MKYPLKQYIAISAGHHYGKCLDFGWNAKYGKYQEIIAVDNGKVVLCGNYKSSGNTIVIKHTDGTCSLYAHLSRISVSSGQKVTIGQTIGNMGATGTDCNGIHLHFGLYSKELDAKKMVKSDLDPFKYLELYQEQVVGGTTLSKYGKKMKTHTYEVVKEVTANPCLRVRKNPSILAGVVGSVKKGVKVTVYEEQNGWSKIGDNQWVSSQYLK